MLDAKIASALKRIIMNQYFRRVIYVEEQHAQKYDRFLRGRHTNGHFRATGAQEAALDLSDLFIITLQGDDIRSELYYLQVKYPRKYPSEFVQD